MDYNFWAELLAAMNSGAKNKNITIDGETKVITDWCNQFGQQVSVVRRRPKRGLSIKEALDVIK